MLDDRVVRREARRARAGGASMIGDDVRGGGRRRRRDLRELARRRCGRATSITISGRRCREGFGEAMARDSRARREGRDRLELGGDARAALRRARHPCVTSIAVVDSGKVGVEKPDPRIFEIALRAIRARRPSTRSTSATRCATDIVGARAAKMRYALIDPFGHYEGMYPDVPRAGRRRGRAPVVLLEVAKCAKLLV